MTRFSNSDAYLASLVNKDDRSYLLASWCVESIKPYLSSAYPKVRFTVRRAIQELGRWDGSNQELRLRSMCWYYVEIPAWDLYLETSNSKDREVARQIQEQQLQQKITELENVNSRN